MTIVEVFLAKAIICFAGTCHPVLVGEKTHPGEYQLIQRYVLSPGYGGDVLKYNEDATFAWSIHRVWTLNPKERRRERLLGPASGRRYVSNGCINVDEKVYEELVDCCSNSKLIIHE